MINEHDLKDYSETFEFVYKNSAGAKTTKEFNTHNLDVVLQEFEQFLRGAGFYFEGRIEVGEAHE